VRNNRAALVYRPGTLYGSLFGYVGNLPAAYTQALMVGIGASGVAVAAVWILLKAAGAAVAASAAASQDAQVVAFFLLAALVSLGSVAAFLLLRKSKVAAFHLGSDSDELRLTIGHRQVRPPTRTAHGASL
jgi:hypothetical protein